MWTKEQEQAMGGMQERKDPKFMTFETGDYVDGILVNMERILVSGKQVIRYTVQDRDGELVSFLGTYVIDTKIRPSDLGHRVVVRCTGEDSTVVRNGNAMKTFQVAVSEKKIAASPVPTGATPLGITDADIPF